MPIHKYVPVCTICGLIIGLFGGGNAMFVSIGFLLGASCDLYYKRVFLPQQAENIANQNFSLALVYLAAKIAKANGRVSTREIASFKKHTLFLKKDYRLIGMIFNEGGLSSSGYESYVAQLRAFFFTHPSQKINTLRLLYNVAYADGIKNTKQLNILQTCAFQWGITQEQIDNIEASIEMPKPSQESHKKSSTNNKKGESFTSLNDNRKYYKLLGVKKSASQAEIKTAYKKLIRKYHPDALRGKGKSEKEIQKGEDKLQLLNEAYDIIKKKK